MTKFSNYILTSKSYKFRDSRFTPNSPSVFASFTINSFENTVKFLKQFDQYFLNDMTATDYQFLLNRFNLSYLFLKLDSSRILLNKKVKNDQETLVKYFESANWLEREVFDMFGVFFNDHPDLRRILTDYGFNSFPFRKDFPVSGYYELSYSLEEKTIKIKDLMLQQSARFFIKK